MFLSELEQWCNEGIPIEVNFTTSREEANNFAKQYHQPPYLFFQCLMMTLFLVCLFH
ncbi:MAG: hypothetical protein QXE31_06195 [Candidatus Woesearchaeota archaeon]